MLALEGPDGGERGKRGRLAAANGSVALDEEADQAGDAGAGVGLPLRYSQEIMEDGVAGLEAGYGEFFLPGEVIGDARGAQANELGNGRQAHALEPVSVQNRYRCRNDITPAALETVSCGSGRFPFRGVGRFVLGLAGEHYVVLDPRRLPGPAQRITKIRLRQSAIRRVSGAMNSGLTKKSDCWLEPCAMVLGNHEVWTNDFL